MIVSSDEHKLWLEHMKIGLLRSSSYLLGQETAESIKTAKSLHFSALFFQKDRNGIYDLTNVVQTIEDLLVGMNYIADDEKKYLQHFCYSFVNEKRPDGLFAIVSVSQEDISLEELRAILNKIELHGSVRPEAYDTLLEAKKALRKQKNIQAELKKEALGTKLDIFDL